MLPDSMLAMAVDCAMRRLPPARRPVVLPNQRDVLVRVLACVVVPLQFAPVRGGVGTR